MKINFLKENGFTLLEIIISVVVTTIIAAIVGIGLIEIATGFTFSKKNYITAQQGQIVMARLKKEFSNMYNISNATATSITFTRSSDLLPRPIHVLSWAGTNGPLIIDGDTLAAPVAAFSLTYFDSYSAIASTYTSSTSIVEIALRMTAAENTAVSLTDRVNLYLETGG